MSQKTVLVVDDSDDLREMLRISLARLPYNIVEAADGRAALDAIARQRPDIVLLDVELPEVGGFEVCRRLRADPATADLKIIMLTAAAQDEDRERALAAGADGYITKPFGLRALIDRLAEELGP